MTTGLATTLKLLTKTRNEAAVAVLLPALDSRDRQVAEGALTALLERHSLAGQREVIRRLHLMPSAWREIVCQQRGRMTHALRDALLGSVEQMTVNACQAILWFHEYDLMPALINAAEDEANPSRDLAAETLLTLADLLYDELAAPRDYRNRRDPQLLRQHVLGSLEESVKRYFRHRRDEIIEAYLLLVARDNATLKQILMDPLNPNYQALVKCLTGSTRGGVMRLVLSFLDDHHAPSSAINVLAHRCDERFVDCLLKKIGYQPSATAAHNLKRIESIIWLQTEPEVLQRLDEAAQHAAVQLAIRSGVPRAAIFGMLELLLQRGKPAGRRAAAEALAQFHGAQANALALRGLEDPDAQVRATVVRQLRPRGIPGALSKLIQLIDGPNELVAQAARESLSEFTLKRFLTSFDLLEEEVRRTTGRMVRKVDRNAGAELAAELQQPSRTRRLRALGAAVAMELVQSIERVVIGLLLDEDHVTRAEAARALGLCDTATARDALTDALSDRSVSVRDAAQRSLQQLEGIAAADTRLEAPTAGNPAMTVAKEVAHDPSL